MTYRNPRKGQRSINLEINVQMKEDGGGIFFKIAQIRVGPLLIKNFTAQELLKNMLTMLANEEKKVQVTVEAYMVTLGVVYHNI